MDDVKTILLIRHGETDWNRDGRVMGELSIPLNPTGKNQASRLAEALHAHPLTAIYSSPTLRTYQTAQVLAADRFSTIQVLPALTEIGMGEWQGRYWKDLADDLVKRNLYNDPEHTRPPGGETLLEVQRRAVGGIEQVCSSAMGDVFLFVTHADVIRTIVAHYLHFELRTVRQARIDHASITALTLHDPLPSLLCLNYAPQILAPGQ